MYRQRTECYYDACGRQLLIFGTATASRGHIHQSKSYISIAFAVVRHRVGLEDEKDTRKTSPRGDASYRDGRVPKRRTLIHTTSFTFITHTDHDEITCN